MYAFRFNYQRKKKKYKRNTIYRRQNSSQSSGKHAFLKKESCSIKNIWFLHIDVHMTAVKILVRGVLNNGK